MPNQFDKRPLPPHLGHTAPPGLLLDQHYIEKSPSSNYGLTEFKFHLWSLMILPTSNLGTSYFFGKYFHIWWSWTKILKRCNTLPKLWVKIFGISQPWTILLERHHLSSCDKPTFCNVVFASKQWKLCFVWFSVDVHLHDDKGNDRRLVSQTNAGCIMMQAMNIFLTADIKNRSIVEVRACKSVSQRTIHVLPLDGLVEMSICEESSDQNFFQSWQTRQMFQIDSLCYCVLPLHHFPVLYLKKRWFSLRTLIVNGSRPLIQTQGSPFLWLWSSFRNQPFRSFPPPVGK